MNMAVYEIIRVVAFHQLIKSRKPHMRQIRSVVKAKSRRVRNQYVKSPVYRDFGPQPGRPPVHLRLCILMRPVLVAHGAAQAHDADPLMGVNRIFNADAAVGRRLCIAAVVIAVHIENRRMGEGGQKG